MPSKYSHGRRGSVPADGAHIIHVVERCSCRRSESRPLRIVEAVGRARASITATTNRSGNISFSANRTIVCLRGASWPKHSSRVRLVHEGYEIFGSAIISNARAFTEAGETPG